MKHILPAAVLLLLLAACSPQIYTVHLDVRQPSTSGLDLARKSLSVVYMDSSAPADSLFDHAVASEIGDALGEDYFGTPEAVGLYHIPQTDTVSLALMRSLVMDTGEDVVFLLDSHLGEPELETNREVRNARSVDSSYVCAARIPLTSALYVYDSMGKDEVRRFNGSTVLNVSLFNSGMVPEENMKDLARKQAATDASATIGTRISRRFLSEWKTEGFSFYYFEDWDSDVWNDALYKAASGQFAAAVDKWARFLKDAPIIKQACASYNIAQAFYMMEDMELATRWLDQADKLENLTLSPGLRKRIGARLEK